MTLVESILKTIFSSNAELEKKVTGSNGSKILEAGGHTSLNAYSFIVQEDTVFTVFKVNGVDSLSAYGISGYTLKAGAYVSVPKSTAITDITVDSGSVIIYNL